MHFPFYPKHEYGCPHVDHCPHLGSASLGSVVHAANFNEDQIDLFWRQIDGLRAENTAKSGKIEELTARVEQLERELKAERQKQFKSTKEASSEQVSPDAVPRRAQSVGGGWPGAGFAGPGGQVSGCAMERGMKRRLVGAAWGWRRRWSARVVRDSSRDRDPRQLDGWIGRGRLPKDPTHCHKSGRRSSDRRTGKMDGERAV